MKSDAFLNKITSVCIENKIPFKTDAPLKNHTSFRIGGNADILIQPVSIEESALIQTKVNEMGHELFVLGGGTNLLISDHGIRDVVLHLAYSENVQFVETDSEKCIVRIPANMNSTLVAKRLSKQGFTGMEFLTTIPGTIGGAIVQNAGCYGNEISNCILRSRVSINGNIHTMEKNEMKLGYRRSIFKENPRFIIHEAEFLLQRGDDKEIQRKIEDYRQNRLKTQPSNRKSAGSVFKNPDLNSNHRAWYYIQECGLKGISIGDAMVSPDHANFIVNNGNATADDVFRLVKLIRATVFEKFNVELSTEIIFAGIF